MGCTMVSALTLSAWIDCEAFSKSYVLVGYTIVDLLLALLDIGREIDRLTVF